MLLLPEGAELEVSDGGGLVEVFIELGGCWAEYCCLLIGGWVCATEGPGLEKSEGARFREGFELKGGANSCCCWVLTRWGSGLE